MEFLFPLDGDCLNIYDGKETGDGLLIPVRVSGEPGRTVIVNDRPAEWDGEGYTCMVPLRHYRTTLTASDGQEQIAIAVYRLHDPVGKYRLSSDDNILFLQDLTLNNYDSLFENPYLAVYKKAHDLYGACVHINIYYEYTAEEMKDFSAHQEYFNLSMMTDRYKEEWRRNADWLRLSFHARRNYPDSPYKNATAAEVARDMELVHREILRFAGPEVLSPVTTLHFGAANLAVTRTLREYGYRGLTGYFELHKGEPLVAYHYPVEHTRHVGDRDFWKDNREDIMFGRIDLVLNSTNHPEKLIAQLEEIKENPHRAGFISIMIHEEYFYPDYRLYRDQFEKLVLEPCKWCFDHGYRGALMSDTMFE